MKPRCLLVMTNFIGMNELILDNISKRYDTESIVYSFDNQEFKYKSIFQRITNFYQKKLCGNKDYKKKLKNISENERIQQEIKKLSGVYDFVLVFSIEYFNETTLQLLKSISKKMIGYQWDGLGRTPEIANRIKFFNKFYTFDRKDVNDKDVFFATNFYLEIPEIDDKINTIQPEYDLLYIGTVTENRLEKIEQLIRELRRFDKKFKVILLSYGDIPALKEQYPYEEISFIKQSMSYKEVLHEVLKTKTILDLKLSVHNGLSFRFFEAMKYHKKIVTDNPTVKDYDFYKAENILIIGNKEESALEDFLKTPYQKIPDEITKKYDFVNWVKELE